MSACAGPNFISSANGGYTVVATGGTAVPITAAMNVCGFAVGGTDICCAETVITGFQTTLNTMRTTLEGLAGKRDEHIIAQRAKVVEALDSLKKISGLSTSKVSSTYSTVAGTFLGYAETIAKNFTSIVENLVTYQDSRATCMNTLLKTQAALLCQSCADTFATTGITVTSATVGTVAWIDAFLDTVNTACYNYLANSAKQSAIIAAGQWSSGLSSLASGIEKAVNGDATGSNTDLATAFTAFAKVTNSATNEQKPVMLPTSCSGTSCRSWIESNLFTTAGAINTNNAILGGTEQVLSFSRILSEGKERSLAVAGLNPTLANYKFTIDFNKNPASVDNTKNAKSALRNGVVAVAVAALALVF